MKGIWYQKFSVFLYFLHCTGGKGSIEQLKVDINDPDALSKVMEQVKNIQQNNWKTEKKRKNELWMLGLMEISFICSKRINFSKKYYSSVKIYMDSVRKSANTDESMGELLEVLLWHKSLSPANARFIFSFIFKWYIYECFFSFQWRNLFSLHMVEYFTSL